MWVLGNGGGTLWKRACETNVERIEGYIYRSMGVTMVDVMNMAVTLQGNEGLGSLTPSPSL